MSRGCARISASARPNKRRLVSSYFAPDVAVVAGSLSDVAIAKPGLNRASMPWHLSIASFSVALYTWSDANPISRILAWRCAVSCSTSSSHTARSSSSNLGCSDARAARSSLRR